MYTHVYYFKVKVGDEVKQGDLLAEVHFQGLDHIHLSRVKHLAGKPYDQLNSYEDITTDNYFNYFDDEGPVIKAPFYFYKDQTDSLISNSNNPTIKGKVDIVVGMRDQGPHSRGPAGSQYYNFGDRLCVSRIEYSIRRNTNNAIAEMHQSFDFSKIGFIYDANQYKKVEIAYKSPYVVGDKALSGDKFFSYYIITNWKNKDTLAEFSNEDALQCWDTNQLNDDGSRKYPDGSYVITVIAYDANGNSTKQEQTVNVIN
jgi:hypothetical protein